MNWNLASYLPKEVACQSTFNAIIAGYISATYQHICTNEETSDNVLHRKRTEYSQDFVAPLGLGALESTAHFAKNLISGEMSQKLFQSVSLCRYQNREFFLFLYILLMFIILLFIE